MVAGKVVLFCGLFAIGVGAVWILAHSGDQDHTSALPAEAGSAPPGSSRDEAHASSGEFDAGGFESPQPEHGKGAAPAAARVPLPLRVAGRVMGLSGTPLGGALFTWTPLKEELLVGPWRGQGWDAIERQTRETEADSAGNFLLTLEGIAHPTPSVLWVTHPGHRAGRVLLLEEQDLWNHADVVLEAAVPIRVSVQDASGAPVPAARVEQRGFARIRGAHTDDEWEDRAWSVFFRNVLTNDAGTCLLPATGKEAAILARTEELVSDAYTGPAVEELVLILGRSYQLSGEVRTVGGEVQGGVSVLLDVEGKRGAAEIPVRRGGTFGPCSLPRPPSGEGTCRLDGGGLIAPLVPFRVPDHGGEVRVTIEARAGASFPVKVQNTGGEPLTAATVRAGFWVEPYWTEWFETGDDGLVSLNGLPASGEITLQVERPGFESRLFGPYDTPREEDEPVVLTLANAGDVEVLVRHGEDPVERFQLLYWDEDPSDLQSRDVRDATDGRYLLRSVRAGLVHMYAYSDVFTQSNVATVSVAAGEAARAELFVTDPIVGTGRIVDGETFLPIQGATVQPHTSFGGMFQNTWGDPQTVDADGRFRVKGFARSNARMSVAAPDYEEDYVSTTPIPGRLMDFGDLPLFKSRAITVRLVSPDIDDFSAYQLAVGGVRQLSDVGFETNGVAVLEGCVPGRYLFGLTDPDGVYSEREQLLQSGEPWEIDWPIDVGTHVTVELKDAPPSSEGSYLKAFHGGTPPRFTMAAIAEGKAVFPALAGDTAVLELTGPTGQVVARRRIELAPPGPQAVSLDFDLTPLRVRVTDPAGTPIAGAELNCSCAGDGSHWETTVRTNGDGIAVIESPPCAQLQAFVFHPVHGHHYGIPVERPVDPLEPAEISIDTAYSVRFQLKDGASPVTGIKAFLLPVEGRRPLPARHPDSQGHLMWTNLGPGTYVVRAGAPGYWFTEAKVEAARNRTHSHEVQLVRTGDLELRLVSSDDAPVPDHPVDVTPLELSGQIADWIREGRVQSSSGGVLATDAQGQLALRGLPRGRYRVSAQSSDGAAQREISVPPGGVAQLELQVP